MSSPLPLPLLELYGLRERHVPNAGDGADARSPYVVLDTAAVFQGLAPVHEEDAILTSATALMGGSVRDREPGPGMADVRSLLKEIVGHIRAAADTLGTPCRRLSPARDDDEDESWIVATAPSETRPSLPGTQDFSLVTQPASEVRTWNYGPPEHIGRAELLRGGVVDGVHHVLRWFSANRADGVRHGVAVVTNTVDVLFLRVNFEAGCPHLHKVILTGEPLSIRCGEGLRYFVRLLCQPLGERAAYGWRPSHHNYLPHYEYVRQLGRGGCGAVCEVTRIADGAALALKVDHRDSGFAGVEAEAVVLGVLAQGRVRGVPRLEALTPEKWLVMSPVGTPLDEFTQPMSPDSHREFAARAACEVFATLSAAHGAGIVHGDVRPPNLVVDPGSRSVVLVDWGVAVRVGEPIRGGVVAYMRPEVDVGSPASALDDLTALGITFVALWLDQGDRVPWDSAYTDEDMEATRAAWVRDEWPAVRAAVQDQVPLPVLAAVDALALAL